MENIIKDALKKFDKIGAKAFVFVLPKNGDTHFVTNLCSHQLIHLSKDIVDMSKEVKKEESKCNPKLKPSKKSLPKKSKAK